jgi:hypothetical protein
VWYLNPIVSFRVAALGPRPMSFLFLLVISLVCLQGQALPLSTTVPLQANVQGLSNSQALGSFVDWGPHMNGGRENEQLNRRLERLCGKGRCSVTGLYPSRQHIPPTATARSKSALLSASNLSITAATKLSAKRRGVGNSTLSSILLNGSASLPEFNPMVSGNVAVYYRQSDLTSQVPRYRYNHPRFVIRFFAPAGWPKLNLGSHCSSPTAAQLQAGAAGLLVCTSNSFDIQIEQ